MNHINNNLFNRKIGDSECRIIKFCSRIKKGVLN